jgi:hypothetical protein
MPSLLYYSTKRSLLPSLPPNCKEQMGSSFGKGSSWKVAGRFSSVIHYDRAHIETPFISPVSFSLVEWPVHSLQ